MGTLFKLLYKGGYRLMVIVYVSLFAHGMPQAVKFAYENVQYKQLNDRIVAIGKPTWEFFAYFLEPFISWPTSEILRLMSLGYLKPDRRWLTNYILNSTPQDAAKYIEVLTSMILLTLLLVFLPWIFTRLMRIRLKSPPIRDRPKPPPRVNGPRFR